MACRGSLGLSGAYPTEEEQAIIFNVQKNFFGCNMFPICIYSLRLHAFYDILCLDGMGLDTAPMSCSMNRNLVCVIICIKVF